MVVVVLAVARAVRGAALFLVFVMGRSSLLLIVT
jgi:hypothetical protein